MAMYFAPGCTLALDKPALCLQIETYLRRRWPALIVSPACCKRSQRITKEDEVIAVCPGCTHHFTIRGFSVRTLYRCLLEDSGFDYPQRKDLHISIHDACPSRGDKAFQDDVRRVLTKMNIRISEPVHTRDDTRCCGDDLCRTGTEAELVAAMTRRAREMPRPGVACTCVSCVRALDKGGCLPYYVPDLVFGVETLVPRETNAAWHARVDAYKEQHERAEK